MTRPGVIVRIVACALAFAALAGPHWLALRFGRRRGWGAAPVLFHRVCLRLFSVRVTQSGTPPTPGEAALVLANHVSWLDIIALGSLRPLSFVAKSEIAGWPVVGPLAALQRTVFIDRARRGATAAVNALIGERLASGELVVLFAEGTTGDGLRLRPFRSSLIGAARAAIEAEGAGVERIHLRPLAITYPRRNGMPVERSERPDIAWYGDMELAPHLALFVARGPIDVHVVWGAPIAFEAGTDRKVAAARAEEAVRAAIRGVRTGRPQDVAEAGRIAAPRPEAESLLDAIRGIEEAGSQLRQAATEPLVELAGPFSLAAPLRGAGANDPPGGFDRADAAAPSCFDNRKVSIYGGSNEIQHDAIAKVIPGL